MTEEFVYLRTGEKCWVLHQCEGARAEKEAYWKMLREGE